MTDILPDIRKVTADPRFDGGPVLISCAMVEDEVTCAMKAVGAQIPVIWVDRGYHNEPTRLRAVLQERIDWVEDRGAKTVLLAFGLCGNGAVGLRTRSATLAMPRFDDCINFMLKHGERMQRGLSKAGVMYLTRGWSQDEAATVIGLRERYALKYGERRANIIMRHMFEGYKAVSLIDNGCYDVDSVMPIACATARELGVCTRVDEGGNEVLEKLLSGRWDDDILVVEPGRALEQDDFEFEDKRKR
jgi:hypothetical protein